MYPKTTGRQLNRSNISSPHTFVGGGGGGIGFGRYAVALNLGADGVSSLRPSSHAHVGLRFAGMLKVPHLGIPWFPISLYIYADLYIYIDRYIYIYISIYIIRTYMHRFISRMHIYIISIGI